MRIYTPDRWVIIRYYTGQCCVFATWVRGKLDGDRWKRSSQIVNITERDSYYLIENYSGSVYKCHKEDFGFSGHTANVLSEFIDGGICEVLTMEEYQKYRKCEKVRKRYMKTKKKYKMLLNTEEFIHHLNDTLKIFDDHNNKGVNDLYEIIEQYRSDIINEILDVEDYQSYFGRYRDNKGFVTDEIFTMIYIDKVPYKELKKRLKKYKKDFENENATDFLIR